MNLQLKFLPLLTLVSLLFLKDVALVVCWSDNPLYWMENVEEQEQKTDNKEEDKKETDDKKISFISFTHVSNQLSLRALHIISARKYCCPLFDVVAPPPERA